MGSFDTGEAWKAVAPLIGVIMFLLILIWCAIDGIIAGVRYHRDGRRAMDNGSPFI